MAECRLCPRRCGADRAVRPGFCGAGASLRVARAALHLWEEPCISGKRGSGTVFFSGCTLKCCFCQNAKISTGDFGAEITVERLAEIFLELQEQGAHNINLVTADPYVPQIIEALDRVRDRLQVPIVYNCGGYESPEILDMLKGYVDVYLPDLKFMDEELSARYLKAPDYFAVASKAIEAMIAQVGAPQYDEEGMMVKGVMIRHLVMPGAKEDSKQLLHWMAKHLPKDGFRLSLMSQFAPTPGCETFPEIKRRVTTYEYRQVLETALSLGLEEGYQQYRTSAKEEYTPPFELQGVFGKGEPSDMAGE
ncbi:MAG: radical SAM protein [Lachnospiraceae bacterium]|nr:radical SAM protein [Lachnospiraceae bacterium]